MSDTPRTDAIRRIVAISVAGVNNNCGTQCNYVTVALCDDGSVFEIRDGAGATWAEYPPIPKSGVQNL